ncbi:hypothetical protein AAF712_010627 [Marasmius tenuissimus]|uniref:MYND-type domain-containing protein n=1 Tax=Marasmius tenuissimus TaxID=585030 RepID=A0ABR2ZMS4_9AGAR|nr:hypothetical protein PM082_000061 [Marasmius tenuissimus]
MIDDRAPLSLHRLVADANAAYNSSRMAIKELRKPGHPPLRSISSVTDTRSITALRVIAALQSAYTKSSTEAASAIKQIRLQWSSLSLWIKLLIEGLVLSEDVYSSPENVEALDHVLILLPSLLDFSGAEGVITDLTFLHCQSPFLPQLIVQVWFKTLEIHHWTYGLWSLLLIELAASSPSPSWYTPISEPAEGRGQAFVGHVYHQLEHIPIMTLQDIREFLAFMCCPALEGSRPLCSYIPGQTLPALVSLLSTVTRKRKVVRTADVDSDEYAIANGITFQILSYISSFIREPYFAMEALDAGLIRVVFRVHPCFMRTDDQITPLVRRFHYLASEIIDRIAMLLVFPAILHRFWKARSTATQSLEAGVAMNFPLLQESWERALAKASAIHEFRQALKDQVSPLCNYSHCSGFLAREGLDRQRYLRCMGCKLTTYCSRACRRLDWTHANHRGICVLASLDRESRPSMIHQERIFLLEWLLHHIRSHLSTVTENLNRHIAVLHQSPKCSGRLTAAQLMSDGEKNPILLVHLHKPGSPTTDDIRVLSFDKPDLKVDDSVGVEWENALFKYWRDESSVTKSNILVAGLLPNHFGYHKTKLWVSLILLDLPMVEPLQYSIPSRPFSCNYQEEEAM